MLLFVKWNTFQITKKNCIGDFSKENQPTNNKMIHQKICIALGESGASCNIFNTFVFLQKIINLRNEVIYQVKEYYFPYIIKYHLDKYHQ